MTKIHEVLQKFQEIDPNRILEVLKEFKQTCIDAHRTAKDVEKTYYADAAAGEEKVKARIDALTKQRDTCQAKITAFKKPLAAATIKGNAEKLASIKADMKALAAEEGQISTEIEMLQSTHIAGSKELHDRVLAENERFKNLREQYNAAAQEIYVFAKEREKLYQNILRTATANPFERGYGIDMDKLDRHYRFELYAESAAKNAAEQAARKAAEASRPRTFQTYREYVPAGEPVDVAMVETPNGTRFEYRKS